MTTFTKRRAMIAGGAALIFVAAIIDVTIVYPRVHVRWGETVSEPERRALEARYGLEAAEIVEEGTWRYELRDTSPENVEALVRDPQVADTAYIDRSTFTSAEREIDISLHRLSAFVGPRPTGLVQPQSLVLVVAGGVLLWAAGLADARRRRTIALAALLATGVSAYALPLRQPIRMGDSGTYVQNRTQFEGHTAVHQVRFEAHLSHVILARIDAMLGRTEDSPARALRTLMHAATAWFLVMALLVGFVERWSPVVVRYLALAVIGPSALMYFGYLELGHLSLNMASFPLLVRGLREGGKHLEASGALTGLGAALHGFGVVAIAGSALACFADVGRGFTPRQAGHEGPPYEITRWFRSVVRVLAWSIAAYLGWIAIYAIVLKLPIIPGHADGIPFRPWFTDAISDRINVAIFSLRGARDVIATIAIVGMPLVAVAASLRRRLPFEARAALLYAIPSLIWVILFWPVQGLGVEMDLLFAAFPALYALAWVSAHDSRHAMIAAAILAGAHLVFWRVVLDTAFVNSRIA